MSATGTPARRRRPRPRSVAAMAAALLGLVALLAPTSAAADGEPDLPYYTDITASTLDVAGQYTPIVGHFTTTELDDIIWYSPGKGLDNRWTPCTHCTTRRFTKTQLVPQVNGAYQPIVGDFAGDDLDDIYWRNPLDGGHGSLWTNDGAGGFTRRQLDIPASYYQWAVLHDARTGPGKDDILWLAAPGGKSPLWVFPDDGSGDVHTVARLRLPDMIERVVLPGDFDGNGATDLVLYDRGYVGCRTTCAGAAQRTDWYWRRASSESGTFTASTKQVAGTYEPVVGRFSQQPDAIDDIVWMGFRQPYGQPRADAPDSLWEGRSSGHFASSTVSLPSAYGGQVVGHDGSDTILTFQSPLTVWFNTTSGPVSRRTGSPSPKPYGFDSVWIPGRFTTPDREDIFVYVPGATTEHLYRSFF